MFTSLKNKIKEETGKEVTPLPMRMGSQGRLQRSNFGSTVSIEGMSYSLEQKDLEIAGLRLQCSELNGKLDELSKQVDTLKASNERLEQSNQLLEESVKVAQRKCFRMFNLDDYYSILYSSAKRAHLR